MRPDGTTGHTQRRRDIPSLGVLPRPTRKSSLFLLLSNISRSLPAGNDVKADGKQGARSGLPSALPELRSPREQGVGGLSTCPGVKRKQLAFVSFPPW